jgi:hypothetical protein
MMYHINKAKYQESILFFNLSIHLECRFRSDLSSLLRLQSIQMIDLYDVHGAAD